VPELDGRVIAVSEMEVNRANMPTLPICMTALRDVTFRHAEQTNQDPWIVEQIVTEFWFESNRIKNSKSQETPFWAYYDYDKLLFKIVKFVLGWTSPKGYKFKITRMDIESSDLAVHVAFEFFHQYRFCDVFPDEPEELRLVQSVCMKTGCEDTKIGV